MSPTIGSIPRFLHEKSNGFPKSWGQWIFRENLKTGNHQIFLWKYRCFRLNIVPWKTNLLNGEFISELVWFYGLMMFNGHKIRVTPLDGWLWIGVHPVFGSTWMNSWKHSKDGFRRFLTCIAHNWRPQEWTNHLVWFYDVLWCLHINIYDTHSFTMLFIYYVFMVLPVSSFPAIDILVEDVRSREPSPFVSTSFTMRSIWSWTAQG